MAKLRISSGINLQPVTDTAKTDAQAYVRTGLEFHKKIGFDAADYPMALMKIMGDNWEAGIADAVRAGEEIGVKFEICHLPFGVKIGGTAEEVAPFNALMHRSIDAAKMLGVDYAVLHPNTTTVPRVKFDRRAEYDSVMAHLAPFAEHAAKIGLNIVVENMRLVPGNVAVHRYCGEADELCEIADALGIGVCWDFGHAHICGLKQFEALAYVGRRLKVLHVNDNLGLGDDHVAPFFGTVDWADAMKGLGAIGFDGLFNFEIGAGRVPAGAREAFARYLLDAGRELIAMIGK